LYQPITFFKKYLSYLGTFRGPPEGASRPTGWEALRYRIFSFKKLNYSLDRLGVRKGANTLFVEIDVAGLSVDGEPYRVSFCSWLFQS